MKKIIVLSIILSCISINSQWVQTDGPYGGAVSSFTVTGNYVFAGLFDNGVYYSTNNGNNWTKCSFADYKISCLASNGSKIYVGTQDSGLYYSSNYGDTWVHQGFNNQWVISIAVNSSNIYAGVWEQYGLYISSDNGISWINITSLEMSHIKSIIILGTNLFVGGDIYLELSTDNGQTWAQLLQTQNLINSVVVNSQNIFVATDASGVFHSSNNGQNWTQSLDNHSVNDVIIKDNFAFAGDRNNTYVSSDNGQNWNLTSLNNSYIFKFGLSGNYLLAGAWGDGVYISSDNGQNWNWKSNGINASFINAFILGNANLNGDYPIFTGTSGFFKTSDNGNNWVRTPYNIYNDAIISLARDSERIYAGTENGTFMISSDNGQTWHNKIHISNPVYSIAVYNQYLFIGSDNDLLMISTDYGETWNPMSWDDRGSTHALLIDKYNSGTYPKLLVGCIEYTTNNGLNWIHTSLYNLESALSTTIHRDSLAATTYYFAGTEYHGVFYSTNYGLNWVQTSLNNKSIHSIVVKDTNVFSSTDSEGVFYSHNYGVTWRQINEGFGSIMPWVNSLIIANSYLFAGFQGSSVWKCPLSEIIGINSIGKRIPEKFSLSQNYPNPFNPVTKIKFDIPQVGTRHGAFVRLVIYDILGREIAVLVNEQLKPGTYEIEWDATNYPSGVYFYRLVTQGFSETKKMVLIK